MMSVFRFCIITDLCCCSWCPSQHCMRNMMHRNLAHLEIIIAMTPMSDVWLLYCPRGRFSRGHFPRVRFTGSPNPFGLTLNQHCWRLSFVQNYRRPRGPAHCKNCYWVELITRLHHLIGFGIILQKPSVCYIMPVGVRTPLPKYPSGDWQLLSISRSRIRPHVPRPRSRLRPRESGLRPKTWPQPRLRTRLWPRPKLELQVAKV